MTERRNRYITIFQEERYNGEWPSERLVETIAWLQSKLEAVPEDYRDSATCEIESIDSWENTHYAKITIRYTRPETDEEMAERLMQEKYQADLKATHEIATLRALQAKYGEKPNGS